MDVCPRLPDSGIMFVSHALDPQSLLDNAARYRNHSLAGLRRSFSRIPPSGLPAPLGPDAAGTAFPGVDRIPHWRLGSARNHLRHSQSYRALSRCLDARPAHPSPGMGHRSALAGWLWLAAPSWHRHGRITRLDWADDLNGLWSGRRAYLGRVRAMAQSPGRVLGAARTRKLRSHGAVRWSSLCWNLWPPVLSRCCSGVCSAHPAENMTIS